MFCFMTFSKFHWAELDWDWLSIPSSSQTALCYQLGRLLQLHKHPYTAAEKFQDCLPHVHFAFIEQPSHQSHFSSPSTQLVCFPHQQHDQHIIALNHVDCGSQRGSINNMCCQFCVEENHLVLLNSVGALGVTTGLVYQRVRGWWCDPLVSLGPISSGLWLHLD